MNSKQDQPISDEHLYEQAALELRDATFGTGLYAKAFAEADGNEDKAAAIYIRLRVAGLKHGISNDGAAVQHDEIAHQYSGSASEHSRTMQGNVQSVTSDHQDTVVSPWARFWARQIDLFMVVIISEVVAGLLGFAGYMGENLILAALFGTVVFGIMGVLYETALIAFMGTTVGKALFALSVKDRSGRNLSVSDSFSRAWRVLWFGNALYLFFPWATLFVWWSNYKQAKKGTVSPWDKAIGTEIEQKPIGGGRFFVGAMFSVIALFLVFLLFTANKAMFRKERADALARSFPAQSAPSDAFDPTTAKIVEKGAGKPPNFFDQFDPKPTTAINWDNFIPDDPKTGEIVEKATSTLPKERSIAQDFEEEVKRNRLAAVKGNSIAQNYLGWAYANGKGVLQDDTEALKWYRQAAARGNASAQENLGAIYGNGQGVARDYVRAHMWFGLAAISGNVNAVKNRDLAAAQMTPQQVDEAQKMTRDCQQRKFKGCD